MKMNNAFAVFARILCTLAFLSVSFGPRLSVLAQESVSYTQKGQRSLYKLPALQICEKNISPHCQTDVPSPSSKHMYTGCCACCISESVLPAALPCPAAKPSTSNFTGLCPAPAVICGICLLKVNASPRSPPCFSADNLYRKDCLWRNA